MSKETSFFRDSPAFFMTLIGIVLGAISIFFNFNFYIQFSLVVAAMGVAFDLLKYSTAYLMAYHRANEKPVSFALTFLVWLALTAVSLVSFSGYTRDTIQERHETLKRESLLYEGARNELDEARKEVNKLVTYRGGETIEQLYINAENILNQAAENSAGKYTGQTVAAMTETCEPSKSSSFYYKKYCHSYQNTLEIIENKKLYELALEREQKARENFNSISKNSVNINEERNDAFTMLQSILNALGSDATYNDSITYLLWFMAILCELAGSFCFFAPHFSGGVAVIQEKKKKGKNKGDTGNSQGWVKSHTPPPTLENKDDDQIGKLVASEVAQSEIEKKEGMIIDYLPKHYQKMQQEQKQLTVCIGKAIGSGEQLNASFIDFCHLIFSGMTNSGKSVAMHSYITQILENHSPEQVNIILNDLKCGVELSRYQNLPHTIGFSDTVQDSCALLVFTYNEMLKRLRRLSSNRCSNIQKFHAKFSAEKMPYIFFVVDEVAGLGSSKIKVELDDKGNADSEQTAAWVLNELAGKARAAGIHLILSTQIPSAETVPRYAKGNSAKLSLRVNSWRESVPVIGYKGAEDLAGQGQGLFAFEGKNLIKVQTMFISEQDTYDIADKLEARHHGFTPLLREKLQKVLRKPLPKDTPVVSSVASNERPLKEKVSPVETPKSMETMRETQVETMETTQKKDGFFNKPHDKKDIPSISNANTTINKANKYPRDFGVTPLYYGMNFADSGSFTTTPKGVSTVSTGNIGNQPSNIENTAQHTEPQRSEENKVETVASGNLGVKEETPVIKSKEVETDPIQVIKESAGMTTKQKVIEVYKILSAKGEVTQSKIAVALDTHKGTVSKALKALREEKKAAAI